MLRALEVHKNPRKYEELSQEKEEKNVLVPFVQLSPRLFRRSTSDTAVRPRDSSPQPDEERTLQDTFPSGCCRARQGLARVLGHLGTAFSAMVNPSRISYDALSATAYLLEARFFRVTLAVQKHFRPVM